MKGALATRSPSGANNAHEKSRRSLIFVLMEVCCSERPIASATLMKRFEKSVSKIGSGPSEPDIVIVAVSWSGSKASDSAVKKKPGPSRARTPHRLRCRECENMSKRNCKAHYKLIKAPNIQRIARSHVPRRTMCQWLSKSLAFHEIGHFHIPMLPYITMHKVLECSGLSKFGVVVALCGIYLSIRKDRMPMNALATTPLEPEVRMYPSNSQDKDGCAPRSSVERWQRSVWLMCGHSN